MSEPASPPSEPDATGGGPVDEPVVPSQPGYTPPPPPPPAFPPQGGYPPPGFPPPGFPPPSFPPPGPTTPPPGYGSSDDKTWALLSHFGGAAGMVVGLGTLGWVVPLIIMLARGAQSPTVRAHAVAALNFQLLWSIVAAIGYITLCLFIGFIIVPVACLMGVIFGIVAGVRANDGQLYRYPASIQMIK